ncbi:unnamed protein product [Gordionus sp. m RMFG-2023]
MKECFPIRRLIIIGFLIILTLAIALFFIENSFIDYTLKWFKNRNIPYTLNQNYLNQTQCDQFLLQKDFPCLECKLYQNDSIAPLCGHMEYFQKIYCNNTSYHYKKCLSPKYQETKQFWTFECCMILLSFFTYILYRIKQCQIEVIINRKFERLLNPIS